MTLLLPLLAAAIAGWLSHNSFPEWINALIAGFAVLVCSIAWALISVPLVGSLSADVALIAAYCGWAVAGPLTPLNSYLTALLPSPLSWLAPIRTAPVNAVSQGMISSAVTPMPQRASVLGPGQTWSNTATAPIATVPPQNSSEQAPPIPPSAS